MTRLATGLLIDPVAKSIGPITIDPSMLSELYLTLGCEVVEYVQLDDHNFLYCDENGLLKDDPEPFFQIDGFAPMAGRAIIFGIDGKTGVTTSTNVKISDLWGVVSFPDIEFVGMHNETGVEHDPILGDVATLSITPVFKQKGKPS